MREKLIYEIYLSVALKFVKKGDLKKAKDSLKIMKKILRTYNGKNQH